MYLVLSLKKDVLELHLPSVLPAPKVLTVAFATSAPDAFLMRTSSLSLYLYPVFNMLTVSI